MDFGDWVEVAKNLWLLYSIGKEIYQQFKRKSPKPESKRRKREHKGKRR